MEPAPPAIEAIRWDDLDERLVGASDPEPNGRSDRVQGDALVSISHLRDCLGVAYLHVVHTNEPVIVRRYGKADVAMVPLWEWRWLKQIEAAIQNGQIDASDFLAGLDDTESEPKEDD